MSVNPKPIFSVQGELSTNNGVVIAANMAYGALTTATGDYTGVSANHIRVYKANATNGGYIQRLRFKSLTTDGSPQNTGSVARIYINNGGDHTVANNNAFFGEQTLPAAGTPGIGNNYIEIDYMMNLALNPGFEIWVGLGTSVASGWICTPIGGQY